MIAVFKLWIFVRSGRCVDSRRASKAYPRHCIVPKDMTFMNTCKPVLLADPSKATGNLVNVPCILILNASNFAYTLRLCVTYDFHIKQPLFP